MAGSESTASSIKINSVLDRSEVKSDGAQCKGAAMITFHPSRFNPEKPEDFFWSFEAFMNQMKVPKNEWVKNMKSFLSPTEKLLLNQIGKIYPNNEWDAIKPAFMKLFLDDDDDEVDDPIQIIEQFLQEGFNKTKAKRQLVQLQTIYKSVSAWSSDTKIERLLKYICPEWLPELLPRIRKAKDLDEIFEKAIEFAKDEADKPKWELNIQKAMQSGKKQEEKTKTMVSNDNNYEMTELTKQITRLTLLIEKQNHPAAPTTLLCFYCSQTNHTMKSCAALNEDLETGKIEKRNGMLCLPNNGPKLIPSENGLRASISGSNRRQVNLIEMAEVIDEERSEEEDEGEEEIEGRNRGDNNHVDAAEKRRGGDIERDIRGIPIVKRAKNTSTSPMDVENGTIMGQNSENLKIVKKPAYKIRSSVEMPPIKEPIEQAMGKATVSVPMLQFLGMSEEGRKFLHSITTRKRVAYTDSIETINNQAIVTPSCDMLDNYNKKSAALYSTKAIRVRASVNGEPVIVVIDPGSELNVANKQWLREMGIHINTITTPTMIDAGDHSNPSNGVAWEVNVQFGQAKFNTAAIAIDKFKYNLLLGLPFLEQSDWKVEKNDNGIREYVITNGLETIRFRTALNQREEKQLSINDITTEMPDGIYHVNLIETSFECNAAKYKPVGKKVHPVNQPLKNEQQLTTNKDESQHTYEKSQRLTAERLQQLVIGDGWLSDKEVSLFRNKLIQVDAAFAFTDNEAGLLSADIEPAIRVPTVPHEPWNFKPYPVPRPIYDKVIDLIRSKIKAGVLEPSIGPYANRWFMIEKKEKTQLCFIQDMQPVNQVTIKNADRPPNAEEITEDASGHVLVTVFDLYSGYDQLPVDKRDRDIFSLHTPLGLMHMTRLPMGWANSVAHFQRIMHKIFMDYIPHKVRIFMDDGVILGERMSEIDDVDIVDEDGIRFMVKRHIQDVVEVLKVIASAGLTISGIKTRFGVREVNILGYECGPEGRKPEPSAVQRIANTPTPADETQIRSFVSACSFFRNWIPNFSSIAMPLYHILKKNIDFYWGKDQELSFNLLKDALTTAPVLCSPVYNVPDRPLIITTDASPYGAGAILTQEDVNGDRYCIRYESYKFNEREQRYAQVKRELFAIYIMLKKLRHYCYTTAKEMSLDSNKKESRPIYISFLTYCV